MTAAEGTPATERADQLGWRGLLLRAAAVTVAALAAIGLLLLLFAWIALHIPWSVPDDHVALTGPTVLYDRHGDELARFTAEVDRTVVALDQISQGARDAIIASEDERFYEHTGVDAVSLLRAVVTNLRTGGISQGGSTLTQQYVKNAYLTSERTFTRKIQEAVISIALERSLTKDEILEDYLNAVYFGEGAYGIEAAARTYFGISASRLTAEQGATLAQLLPAPSSRNPRSDPGGARDRRDLVLDKMVRLGTLDAGTAEGLKARSLGVRPRPRTIFAHPHIVEYLRRQLIAAYGEDVVLTGALEVTTTVDLGVQQALEDAVAEHLPADEAGYAQASAVAIDPRTGEILGWYPGRSRLDGDSDLDLAMQYRSIAGSTFKPFVYMAALEQGFSPTTVYPAPSRVRPTTCNEPSGHNPFKPEGVANAGGRDYGSLQLQDALANSVNTVFIQLGCDIGPEHVVDVAGRLGVRTPVEAVPYVSLGNPPHGPTTVDMASAFGTIANDGLHCPAHAILSLRDREGRRLTPPDEVTIVPESDVPSIPRRHDAEQLAARPRELRDRDRGGCYAMMSSDIVRTTTETLTRVVSETTATRANIGRPQAGKTGTADDEMFAWFVGFTPDLAIAVQMSDPLVVDPYLTDPDTDEVLVDDDTGLARSRARVPLHNVAGFRRVQGGTIPALIWKSAAEAILADVPPTDFLEPGEVVGNRRQVGPARSKPPVPTPTPSESPSPSDSPSVEPSTSESPSPGPSESASPCLIILQCPPDSG